MCQYLLVIEITLPQLRERSFKLRFDFAKERLVLVAVDPTFNPSFCLLKTSIMNILDK